MSTLVLYSKVKNFVQNPISLKMKYPFQKLRIPYIPRIETHVCVYVCICMCMCVYTVCMYMYVCVCMCVCVYIYVYITGILTHWYLLLWTSVHCITIEKIYKWVYLGRVKGLSQLNNIIIIICDMIWSLLGHSYKWYMKYPPPPHTHTSSERLGRWPSWIWCEYHFMLQVTKLPGNFVPRSVKMGNLSDICCEPVTGKKERKMANERIGNHREGVRKCGACWSRMASRDEYKDEISVSRPDGGEWLK